MAVYGASFLALILLALPAGAAAVDRVIPAWQPALPVWGRWAGGAVFVAALVTYLWSAAILSGRGRGGYVEFDPPRELVTSGPFARCRNPVAGCVVLMLLGLALALSSTTLLLVVVAALPIAHAQVVLLEEPLLRARFGEAFERHCATTPRWIPWPRRGRGA